MTTNLTKICLAPEGLQNILLTPGKSVPATVSHSGNQLKVLIGAENISFTGRFDMSSLPQRFDVHILTSDELMLIEALLQIDENHSIQIVSDLQINIEANNSGASLAFYASSLDSFPNKKIFNLGFEKDFSKLFVNQSSVLWCMGSCTGQNIRPFRDVIRGPVILKKLMVAFDSGIPYNLEWSRGTSSISGRFYKVEITLPGLCKGTFQYVSSD